MQLYRLVKPYRSPLLIACAIAFLIASASAMAEPTVYSTESKFVVGGANAEGSRLAGLAAQLGVSMGGGQNTTSPEFYRELLTSRQIRDSVATGVYWITAPAGDTIRGTLAGLYGLESGTVEDRRRAMRRLIGDLTSVAVDPTTGIITVGTRSRWPELAIQLNQQLLAAVSGFDAKIRKSRGAAERGFVQRQLETAKVELDAVQQAQRAFRERNRRVEGSPRLLLESQRLYRESELREQLYAALVRALEQARMAEVRSTPRMTVIQSPLSASPVSSAHPLRSGLQAIAFVIAAAIGAALAWEYLRREASRRPAEWAEIRRQVRATRRIVPFA